MVLLGHGATQEELSLSNPKLGGRAGCPEVEKLEETGRLPSGRRDGQLVSCVVLVHTHVNSAELFGKIREEKFSGSPDVNASVVGNRLNIFL